MPRDHRRGAHEPRPVARLRNAEAALSKRVRIALVAFGIAIPATARAQHHHGGDPPRDDEAESRAFGVGVALIAARYDTTLYGGDYQAVMPTVRWAHRDIVVSAALPIYR